jgi:hypothetical protein
MMKLSKETCRTAALLVLLIGVVAMDFIGSYANVYISQSGAGTMDGSTCGNAKPLSFFNTSGNWGSGGAQIGPDTFVHACGAFVGAASSTIFTFQGSGSSGHPITLLFESGATVSAPYFAPNNGGSGGGGINMSNLSYLIVDGGSNGVLQNTANGSALANQQYSIGIEAEPCNNCEVRNLTIQNIYVEVAPSDSIGTPVDNHINVNAINLAGSNWLFHGNVLRDCGWCIHNFFGNGDTNVKIYSNDISRCDHAYAVAGNSGASATNFYFYSNHVHDFANWDDGLGNFHHDGVHSFGGFPSSNLTNLQTYDNLFDGNPGKNFTSYLYIEKNNSTVSCTNCKAFNNVLDGRSAPIGSFGLIGLGSNPGLEIYDNTLLGTNFNINPCMVLNGVSGTFKNNVFSGCYTVIWELYNASTPTMDYNTYANLGTNGVVYTLSGAVISTLGGVQAHYSGDAHSQVVSSAGLNSSYVPVAPSPAINAGTNLTSLGIVALDFDRNGNPRPNPGNWDAGALNNGAAPPPLLRPNPPTGVTAVPH